MSTQLRLLSNLPAPKEPEPSRAGPARAPVRAEVGTKIRAKVRSGRAGRAGRVTWGEWRLDARTRRAGRVGIAAARAELERARAEQPVARAS